MFVLAVGPVDAWAEMYAESTAISAGVEFVHLFSLVIAGGFALAYDRQVLASAGQISPRAGFAAELATAHTPVLVGLTLVFVSGGLLLAADLESFLSSRMFWMKMGALALLLLNGLAIRRANNRLVRSQVDVRSWRALRHGAARSMLLWTGTVLLGVLLTRMG